MDWLRTQRPELVSRYEELYRHGAYAPGEERKRLTGLVRERGTSGYRRLSRPPAQPERIPSAPQQSLF
jgi:hypothetical protein